MLPVRGNRGCSGCLRLVLWLDCYDWIRRSAHNLGWMGGGDRVLLLGSDLLDYNLLMDRR